MSPPDQRTLWLAVVVLLLMWLLTRSREQRIEHHDRKKPLTEDELGRALFQIARDADLAAFRQLYLTGAEAQRVMGQGAEAYLSPRNGSWLVEELVEIAARIGDRTSFVTARLGPESMLWMSVRAMDGSVVEFPVGRVVQVGLFWRIRDPVGQWERYGKERAKA